MKTLLYRPVHFAVLMFIIALVVSLGIIGWLNWRNLERLQLIKTAVNHIHDIQHVGLRMQHILYEDLSHVASIDHTKVREAAAELEKVVNPVADLSTITSKRLNEALLRLGDDKVEPRAALVGALGVMREALYEETGAESRLLMMIDRNTRTEVQLATLALVLLPGLLGIGVWLLRQRIFRPINDLKDLLLRLTEGDFAPVGIAHVDPLLLPLFNNYNQMVVRLGELEQAHRRHAVSLQGEVRAVTQALLRQQQSLARAERLAAVGELSAAVAHELRNPLAGMQMTLANLRRDFNDATLVERLDLVIAELQRITRLLNDLLTQSRHVPEPKRQVQLASLIRELLQLTRYQTPPEIRLQDQVPAALECLLPPDGLRQALLNLVLNGVQALDGQSGTVLVTAKREGDTLHISVCDDGKGFPYALLTGGIRPFASNRETGTGLGLAMAQRFARDLGGELRLSNTEPHGACAELMLPCGRLND